MARVVFHPEASEDYENAFAWYFASSRQAAVRFEAEVDRVASRIAENPLSFPAVDEEHRYAILKRFPFTLVYSVDGEKVLVVAVAHSKRRPEFWRRRGM